MYPIIETLEADEIRKLFVLNSDQVDSDGNQIKSVNNEAPTLNEDILYSEQLSAPIYEGMSEKERTEILSKDNVSFFIHDESKRPFIEYDPDKLIDEKI